MEETDDSLDDWRDHMLSPKGLFLGFMSEPCFTKPVSDVLTGGESASRTNNVKEVEVFMSNSEPNLQEDEIGVGPVVEGDTMVNDGGSIAERRTAKFGFDPLKISSPRFRSSSPLASPGARSPPCLTIPAGISPNALLDSPVMLPNSQLSPTTGTLAFPPVDHDNPMFKSKSFSADMEQDGDDVSSFRLKPRASPVSVSCYRSSQNKVHSTGNLNQSFRTEVDCQSLVPVQPPTDLEFPGLQDDPTPKNLEFESPADSKIPFDISMKAKSSNFQFSSHSYGVADNEIRDSNETAQALDAGGGQSLIGVQKGLYPSVGTIKTSEDGYNWRKYGQKQVKGSEYPRSYYKCTHPSCLVKKKVERSHDGEITEIIYKGAHNHPKPQPSRRSTFGSTAPFGESTVNGEGSLSCAKAEPVWREMQQVYKDIKVGSDWKYEGLDITSSTSVVTEVSDPHSSNQKPVGVLESADTPELSSTLASHDDEDEDTTTQGSLSVGEDDGIESDSKRRKKEGSMIETALGSRALREPRVIVQIESEVDIIDDGYRWRKYGQKVVKGNPNPRSYYKCTSAGCTVRKHVERASHNLKYVLTTYEGKHNHPVPASRNSSHMNSGTGNLPPLSNSQSTLTLPRNSHLPKPEPQDFAPPFDRKMGYDTEFLRPNYLGNLTSPSSSLYSMKFPAVASSALYSAFGLNPNGVSSAPPIIPSVRDLSIPLPLNFPLPSSFAMAGYGNPGRPINPVPPLFMGHHLKESDVKLLRPKQEQRDESYGESSVTTMDHNNAGSSAPSW